MARYVMILRGATSLRGALEGVGPENRDFFGPKKVELLVHNCAADFSFAQLAKGKKSRP
jgi:hypothetical protein